MTARTIWLHRAAPPKPPLEAACNGCGVCCASAPCPLGMLASGRVAGRCSQLRFDETASRYRCGLMPRSPPAGAGWVARASARTARALIQRWIGAGTGCDSTVDAFAWRSGASTEG